MSPPGADGRVGPFETEESMMSRNRAKLLNELSTTDLKNLLAARERIDILEKEQTRLRKELAAVESELDKLMAGTAAAAGRKPARKRAAKKTTRKKTTHRKAAKKAAAAKPAARAKASGKKAGKKAAKKTAKKAAAKPARRKAGARSGVKLEDVVAGLIRKARGPVAYKDLYKSIVEGKLYATRSSNFDNVLRRTLSTSKIIKRVGRGVYGLK
jgi:hypothetical protein